MWKENLPGEVEGHRGLPGYAFFFYRAFRGEDLLKYSQVIEESFTM